MVAVGVGCRSETDAAEDAVDTALCRNDIEKLNEGNLFGKKFGGIEKCCVELRKEMSLETQTMEREIGELEPASGTPEHFGVFERPRESDAKLP